MIPRQPRRLVASSGWLGRLRVRARWRLAFAFLVLLSASGPGSAGDCSADSTPSPFEFARKGSPNQRRNGQMFAARQSRSAGDQVRLHGIRLEPATTAIVSDFAGHVVNRTHGKAPRVYADEDVETTRVHQAQERPHIPLLEQRGGTDALHGFARVVAQLGE